MRAKAASRYAVFLILLVLGQEFVVARYAIQNRWKSLEKDEEEKELKEVEEVEEVEEVKENELAVQKKNIGTAVVVITMTVTVLGVGLQIFNKIMGCCGTYPKACTYLNQFKKVNRTKIQPLSKAINSMALEVENRKEDIIQANYKLLAMWNELKRIGEYEQEIVATLAPSIVKAMNDKWKQIADQLKASNDTVRKWTYQQIETQFKSYFDSFGTTMLGLSSFFGSALMGVSMIAFRSYKKNLISKMVVKLSTGPEFNKLVNARGTKTNKLMGMTDINVHIKQTATAKVNSKFIGSRYATLFKGLNILSGLVAVGFEIYGAILQFKQCEAVRNEAKKGLDEIRVSARHLQKTNKTVNAYYDYLNKNGWDFITNQMTNYTFQNTLAEILKMAKGAATQTPAMKSTATSIDAFLKNINGSVANTAVVQQLQANLIKGLISVKFLLKCYLNKGKLLKYVSDHCKTGNKALRLIYTDGEQFFKVSGTNCVQKGVPYATFASLLPAIRKMAIDGGYSADCVLNNAAKRKKACSSKTCDKNSVSTIATEMSLTVAQVNHYLLKCPNLERSALTPAEKTQVCQLRTMWKASDAQIKKYLGACVKLSAVTVYKCPPPPT